MPVVESPAATPWRGPRREPVRTSGSTMPVTSSGDTAMVQPLGIAVVGLGYWGPNLLRNLVELTDVDVVFACDRRPDALATVARRYPGIQVTTSLEETLSDPRVD